MAPPNKRQKLAHSVSSLGQKGFLKGVVVEAGEDEDPSVEEVAVMIEKLLAEELIWKETKGPSFRGIYFGDSVRTQQRKKSEEQKRVA